MKFVFKVKIKPGATEQQFVNAWKQGSEVIQASEGAEGTILHRNEDGELLTVASWKSRELRDRVMERLNADPKAKEIMDLDSNYGDIEILGHFEDIARVQLTK